MAYNILFTSMFAAGKGEPLRYYFANEGSKKIFTDALLTVEATTKYIMSREHIDEILILGRRLTYDAGDDERVLGVDDGKSFYTSDINDMSTYSLYRYRLSQYIDDLRIEQKEAMDLLDPDQQKEVEAFLRNYYNKHGNPEDEHRKYSRFFDELVSSSALYDGLRRELAETIPDAADRMGVYLQWIKNYLYMNLKDSSKMEVLPGNENANVRFVHTTVDDEGKMPIDSIIKIVNTVVEEHDEVNIYIALNNDDMTDNFVILSVLDILDAMHGRNVTVRNVYTSTNAHYQLAGMIRNDTEGYGIASLVAATKTFLRYGKVDMIVDYWENSRSKNDQVEKMIYAMRRIDTGLSLCDIGEIERGIQNLRELFRGGFDLTDADYYSKLFILMAEGIRSDYGKLVTSDETGFIDLVKWAYNKGFYQQCLTLIEARTPRELIGNGIFYYCNDESDRERVVEIFGRLRSELKPHEFWKMDDLDHYFMKYYFRFKVPATTIENQRINACEIVNTIDNTDPNLITAYTACDERQAVENLIMAYIHIGRIRNATNHAEEGREENNVLFSNVKDVSSKMVQIRESIEYFIHCYETAIAQVCDKDPNVIRVSPEEVKAVSKRIERERGGRDHREHREHRDNSDQQ